MITWSLATVYMYIPGMYMYTCISLKQYIEHNNYVTLLQHVGMLGIAYCNRFTEMLNLIPYW